MSNENGNLVQITKKPEGAAKPMALETARQKLDGARGPKYWRTLEELSGDPSFTAMVENEFPRYVSEWTDGVSRRNFLKLSAASLAIAGLSACTRQPEEAIVPYVNQPEELIPGKPLFFATARPSLYGAAPLLVRSNEYHPTKIEGNPDHPIAKGATDAFSQGSLYDLYDPDRAQAVIYNGGLASRQNQLPGQRAWGDVVSDLKDAATAQRAHGGAGIRFLTEAVTSPSLAWHIRGVLQGLPQAKWYQWEPVNRDNARAGQRMALGSYLEPQYQLDKADVIVSLDADFLSGPIFPGHLKLARDFASRRKIDDPKKAQMSRLYVVESNVTTTGGKADHRLPMKASQVEAFAAALASRVGAGGANANLDEHARKFLDVVVKELTGARGKCVVIPGEQQSPAVHALAAAMNSALGAVGSTVVYGDPIEIVPTEQAAALKELVADMSAGKVTALVIIGADPVYTAPADLEFEKALQKVPLRIATVSHANATSRLCHWLVPMAHYLESWGDARAYDGSVSIIQPLIDPLYSGKTAYDMFAAFTDNSGQTAYEIVQNYWKAQGANAEFEKWWRKALHDGIIANSAPAPKNAVAKGAGVQLSNAPATGMEIVFRPDPSIFDGRYGNNGWLQELPKTISKLTWDNAALMSLNTAEKFPGGHVENQDVIELNVGGRKVEAPVLILPGMPDDTITVSLGYGQTYSGRVAQSTEDEPRGFNAYALRTSTNLYSNSVSVAHSKRDRWILATQQYFHLIDGRRDGAFHPVGEYGTSEAGEAAVERGIVRSATLAAYQKNPKIFQEEEYEAPSRDLTLYGENGYSSWTEDPAKTSSFGPDAPGKGHQWGMAIDMNSCVGCNACVVACQAENNIPVVGKEQVKKGRHMNWLRIDTYFESSAELGQADVANPRAYFQPIPCMQCENAPCEPVCPVGATTHSPEGLNNMVYNRCVGTRYCQNNCPYKVRRFNFLLFADYETESLYPMRNPDVSVRSRGVMEKCTYCVQRITAARIHAEKELRKVRDGEIVTACQQSCPTDAIVFGDLSDPNSRVVKLKQQERNYAMLAELNTRPRTTYLAAVRNPNEELEPMKAEGAHHAG
jgi:MoCo/4Fe-4S cofactor protein with predicted Tat translocation signal